MIWQPFAEARRLPLNLGGLVMERCVEHDRPYLLAIFGKLYRLFIHAALNFNSV